MRQHSRGTATRRKAACVAVGLTYEPHSHMNHTHVWTTLTYERLWASHMNESCQLNRMINSIENTTPPKSTKSKNSNSWYKFKRSVVMLYSQCNSEQTFENPYLLQGQIPLKILHPRNPPNPGTQIPRYKFKWQRHSFFLFLSGNFAVCCAFASTQKTPQNTEKPPISEKSADQRNFFCAFGNARQTAKISVDSKLWPRKQRKNVIRGTKYRYCGWHAAAAARPTKSQFEFVPRDTEKSEFVDLVDFGDVAFSVESIIFETQSRWVSRFEWLILTNDAQRLNTATLSGLVPTYLIFEWVMSHILMSHAAHVNKSCRSRSTTESGNIEWLTTATCHRWMSHVAPINESCRARERVMSQVLNDLIGQDGVAYYCHTKNRMPMSGRNSQNSQNTQLRIKRLYRSDFGDTTHDVLHQKPNTYVRESFSKYSISYIKWL